MTDLTSKAVKEDRDRRAKEKTVLPDIVNKIDAVVADYEKEKR